MHNTNTNTFAWTRMYQWMHICCWIGSECEMMKRRTQNELLTTKQTIGGSFDRSSHPSYSIHSHMHSERVWIELEETKDAQEDARVKIGFECAFYGLQTSEDHIEHSSQTHSFFCNYIAADARASWWRKKLRRRTCMQTLHVYSNYRNMCICVIRIRTARRGKNVVAHIHILIQIMATKSWHQFLCISR